MLTHLVEAEPEVDVAVRLGGGDVVVPGRGGADLREVGLAVRLRAGTGRGDEPQPDAQDDGRRRRHAELGDPRSPAHDVDPV